MKKNGTKVFTLIIFLLVIVALGYYTYLTNNTTNHQSVGGNSEKDILLNYDMTSEYPKTARETVKLHCRYLKYVYNSESTDDELFTLNQQMRKLFDTELLEYNSPDKQLQSLKEEIQFYKDTKKKFVSYTIAETSQIEYNTESDKEYAKMRVSIALSLNGASVSMDQEYILRQDEEGKWKILGWQPVNQEQTIKEGEAE